MGMKLRIIVALSFCVAAASANAATLYWGKTPVKTASYNTCMSFAYDAMRNSNVQNIRRSPDEVAGTLGGTYAAITCVGASPEAIAVVMVVGENGAETMRVRDALRTKIAGIIRFD